MLRALIAMLVMWPVLALAALPTSVAGILAELDGQRGIVRAGVPEDILNRSVYFYAEGIYVTSRCSANVVPLEGADVRRIFQRHPMLAIECAEEDEGAIGFGAVLAETIEIERSGDQLMLVTGAGQRIVFDLPDV